MGSGQSLLRPNDDAFSTDVASVEPKPADNTKIDDEQISRCCRCSENNSSERCETRERVLKATEQLNRSTKQIELFNEERETYLNHVRALKEVVRVTKEMVRIRDVQLDDLQTKIQDIESRLADKELTMLANDLRREYETQLASVQNLRDLYENRQIELRNERDAVALQLLEANDQILRLETTNNELKEHVANLESDASTKFDKIHCLESNLGLSEAECRELKSEIHVINQLFGQVLFGYHNNSYDTIDLDKMLKLLEENHDLLKEISRTETDEYSTVLPKTLLDLITQTMNDECESEIASEAVSEMQTSSSEIVTNLPKVWRILITLLDQQKQKKQLEEGQDTVSVNATNENENQTNGRVKGRKYVLSLSQTYIRLKDLILEKRHLQKESRRLKQLNGHLEARMLDQQSKLDSVMRELSNTWHCVDRIRKQHEKLHEHESVLRYDLGLKRTYVQNLKKELNLCKEKWDRAREQNLRTEQEWTTLKLEFKARKSLSLDETPTKETKIKSSSSIKETMEIKPKLFASASFPNQLSLSATPSYEIIEKTPALLAVQQSDDSFVADTAAAANSAVVADDVETAIEAQPEDKISGSETSSTRKDSEEEFNAILKKRENRLKNLENQCSSLVDRLTNSSTRGDVLIQKLDQLHEAYSEK